MPAGVYGSWRFFIDEILEVNSWTSFYFRQLKWHVLSSTWKVLFYLREPSFLFTQLMAQFTEYLLWQLRNDEVASVWTKLTQYATCRSDAGSNCLEINIKALKALLLTEAHLCVLSWSPKRTGMTENVRDHANCRVLPWAQRLGGIPVPIASTCICPICVKCTGIS